VINRHPLSIRRAFVASLALPLFALVALAGSDPASALAPSVENSMGPVALPGLKIDNFGVVDGFIFRGEQPSGSDYARLAAMNVTTIIDLRLDAKSDAREKAEAVGLKYVNIPIDDHKQPTDADVAAFLEVLDEASASKVYVHCAGGRHRTGSMLAIYRMVREGWTVEKAYSEMLAYDFYTRNGHKGFKTYVFDYWNRMQSDPSSVPAAYCAADGATAAATGANAPK
jgi:tyrosine-protein phosphatase SIW14